MASPDDSDSALVLAAQGGDRDALAVLLARHWPLLRALCRRALGGDALLAEDAAQEAALQAMLSLTTLRRADRFGPWLGGIGLNVCRRWRRYRTEEAWSWEALVGGRRIAEPVDWRAGPEELAEAADLRAEVRRAVDGLPRGQRAAVLLFYLEGLPHAETAALLGVEVGAVKTRLHKARRSLRHRLASLWKEETMVAETQTEFVEVRVADVRRRLASGRHHMVILEEIGGPRRLEIWVGPYEGETIAAHLQGIEFSRPLTTSFMANLLQAGGVHVREVRVSRLVEDVFYATVVVEGAGGPAEVDARPSDALSLALVNGTPIRVASLVLEAAPSRDIFFGPDAEGAVEIAAAMRGSWPGAGAPHAPPAVKPEERP